MRSLYALKLIADLVLVKAQGIRVVWTVHDVRAHDAEYPQIDLLVRKAIANVVDALFVHDPATRDRVAETYGISSEAIAVVPHGHYRLLYDGTPSREKARRDLGVSAHGTGQLFLHLGLLRPYKGIDDLFAAWERHVTRYPEDRLIVAGKPLDESYGAHLAAAANDLDGVDLRLGYVADEDIPAFYGAADVVVLPFRQITTSGSLILAMSFGCPVIAPDADGLKFAASGADDLFYPASDTPVEPLVNALHRASTADLDDLRDRTQRACDALDWDMVARRTKAVYEGSRPPPVSESLGRRHSSAS
jgi:glycosyltransferase involved in cell wall biosynthesis